ncbi:unnamed protein product, partial [Rotaria socialis]
WIRSPKPPTNVLSPRENQQQIRSPSSYTPDSIPSCIFDEPGNEIEIIASESSCSSSNVADIQHVSSSIEYETSNKSNLNKNQKRWTKPIIETCLALYFWQAKY